MNIAYLPALLLLGPSPQKTSTLTIKPVGMAFSYPRTWKKKDNKDGVVFTIPVAGSASPATLNIYSVIYRTDQSDWEAGQKQIAEQLNRVLIRQWEEQLLGVPLLLAKTNYKDKGSATTALNGMLYSSTPRKLVFRLIASADAYDTAEFEFRNALQTLHTINGAMPDVANPDAKPVDLTKKVPPIPKVTEFPIKTSAVKVVPGAVVANLLVSAKPVQIRLPKGWTAHSTESGLSLSSATLHEPVSIQVVTTSGSDTPEIALIRSASHTLDLFKSVSSRTESTPAQCVGGATVSRIWRRGVGAKGPLTACDAAGQSGTYYWIVQYVHDGAGVDQKAIDELLDTLRIDPGS